MFQIFGNAFYITLTKFCENLTIIKLSVAVQIMSTNFLNILYNTA